MKVPERVVAFLRGGNPGAFCDDCIQHGLDLPRRQEVAIVTLTLSMCREFQPMVGSCSSKDHMGNQQKLVIRAI
jgi:hypothetical protein